jgi:fatty-acyl-CoA synthase
LPKAANINHYRVLLAMQGFAGVTDARASDRMYTCLPMYHTNGGVVAPGAVLMVGGACVIRERFSTREFWADIVRHDCTMFVYIGELCRYLVNSPPHPDEKAHRIRLCFGNGLRPDVWQPFKERFRIPRIVEFYGATEGNCSMFNFDSTPGAVGRVPKWAEKRFPIKIIKFDVEAEEPVRNGEGHCTECAADEPGEVIGQILSDPTRPANRFEGYADKTATEKKILRDVFQPGDAWFRTGDLLRKDRLGYYYFVDRIGDTFRRKGENVATSEVSEAITSFPGVREANVYGVVVPGVDGKAGMASLVVDELSTFDFPAFYSHCAARLADYARPAFLRFPQHLDVTGTFKQRKLDLVAEGFDPTRITDPLFVVNIGARSFDPIDAEAHRRILSGALRL